MAYSATVTGYPNPRTGLGLGSGVDGEDVAMLLEGHWIPAKMPMHAVYPRPDSETRTYDRHRNFHSSFRYEIPIGVQGGAWPFFYTLLSAPAGATIGEQYGDPNYGVIDWTPSGQAGVQRFAILVVDQDGNKINLSWSVNLNDAAFVFIDSKVAISGSGTFASPLKLFTDWYKNSVNDATYLNKIAVFVGGGPDYVVTGDAVNTSGNVGFNLAAKTNAIIGDPDNMPKFNCGTAKFLVGVALDGLYVSHIEHANARQDVADAHYWWVTAFANSVTFFRNKFNTIGPGTAGTDNTGPIFIATTTEHKNNHLFKLNTFENIVNYQRPDLTYYNSTLITSYKTDYLLIEQNIINGCEVGAALHAKANRQFVTIRGNICLDCEGKVLTLNLGSETQAVPHDQEVCYNRVVLPLASESHSLISALSNAYEGQSYNISEYRNSLVGGSPWVRFAGAEPHENDANVVVTNLLSRWDPTQMTTSVPNAVQTSATSLVDPNTGLLTGAGLSYLGTKGAEIA